jgi:hypothetical protein
MIFFILIVVIVLAAFITILEQNTNVELAVVKSRQIDIDKSNELLGLNVNYDFDAHTCTIKNNGALVVQILRLWIENRNYEQSNLQNSQIDYLNGNSNGVFAPGQSATCRISDDVITGWFITARGNNIPIPIPP